jgi:hypothetical protein
VIEKLRVVWGILTGKVGYVFNDDDHTRPMWELYREAAIQSATSVDGECAQHCLELLTIEHDADAEGQGTLTCLRCERQFAVAYEALPATVPPAPLTGIINLGGEHGVMNLLKGWVRK